MKKLTGKSNKVTPETVKATYKALTLTEAKVYADVDKVADMTIEELTEGLQRLAVTKGNAQTNKTLSSALETLKYEVELRKEDAKLSEKKAKQAEAKAKADADKAKADKNAGKAPQSTTKATAKQSKPVETVEQQLRKIFTDGLEFGYVAIGKKGLYEVNCKIVNYDEDDNVYMIKEWTEEKKLGTSGFFIETVGGKYYGHNGNQFCVQLNM